jgi:hypothetical protein
MYMYRKIAVAGATAAAIVGVGTAAMATSGSDSTVGSGSQQGSHQKQHARAALMRHLVHGQIVTHGKDGYVVHSGIRGTVGSVSATSITVKAADGFSQTFTLTKDTKVRERTAGQRKGSPGKIADLKSGDKVAVLGKAPEKSSANPSATIVVDGRQK